MESRDELQSTALLTEILGVLKKIDGHLDSQKTRLNVLDAKISALTIGPSSKASSARTRSKGIVNKVATAVEREPNQELTDTTRRLGGTLESSSKGVPAGNRLSYSEYHSKVTSGVEDRQGDFLKSPIKQLDVRNDAPTAIDSQYSEGSKTDQAYFNFRPPDEWCKNLPPQRATSDQGEAEILWTKYLGDLWSIPPDGRIQLTFQRHVLESVNVDVLVSFLEIMRDVCNSFSIANTRRALELSAPFTVTDIKFDPGVTGSSAQYAVHRPVKVWKGPSDPSLQKNQPSRYQRTVNQTLQRTGFWKRIMSEVRAIKLVTIH